MINLIPPEAKKVLQIEYWTRVLSVWLLIWSAALFAGALSLLPVQVLISTQTSIREDSVLAATEKVSNYADISTSLVQASLQAKFVQEEGLMLVLSDYITRFQNQANADIQINRISISREETGIKPISISGIADSRQSLASFRDRLLILEDVLEVDLPISNLAKDKDIAFAVTLTLRKE